MKVPQMTRVLILSEDGESDSSYDDGNSDDSDGYGDYTEDNSDYQGDDSEGY